MRVSTPRLVPLALLLLPLLAACRDRSPGTTDGEIGGTLVFTVPAAPGSLMPPLVETIQSKQVTDLVYERLVEIGPELNTVGTEGFDPGLAQSWSWSADSLVLTFRLDSAARWHDGRPVVAEDVRRTFELVRDPATGSHDRTYLKRIDSVTTPDARSVAFWFAQRYPEQFFDAGARISILPSHRLEGVKGEELRFHPLASAPMGSGRFRFVRAEPGSLLELAADSAHHRGRPKLDRVLVNVTPDFVTATSQLFAGETDVYEALRLENMPQAASSPTVEVVIRPSTSYSFLAFNFRDPAARDQPHPFLTEPGLRRAIAMAVDRQALVRQVMDTLGVVGSGPHPRTLTVADTTVAHPRHSMEAAAALLDSLGWRDANGDGVRERRGRPLALTVLVPSSSALRQRLALILQQQLATAGVQLNIRQLEFNTFVQEQSAGRFDVTLGSWILTEDSPSGLRNTWGTNGGQNVGGYSNPVFDAHVDSGNAAFDPETRRAHFRRAFEAIAQDVPAIWLYEPHNVIGINRRFQHPPLRASSWWLDLHEWWVPTGERLPRDRAAPGSAEQP